MRWFSLWLVCEALAWVLSPLIFSILALGPIEGMRRSGSSIGAAPLRWLTFVNFIAASWVSVSLWLTRF